MAPSAIQLPRTRRWTRVEYERLIKLGVFRPDERLELLDGQLVVREPQGSRHAATIRRVIAALRRALGDTWQIAETSYRIDRDYKAGLYARAGVRDYWVIDVVQGVLEVHREPDTAGEALWRYRSIATLRPPALVTPLVAPDRSIRVSDLLP